jgi:predicted ribosome quality control (RQC) complex YloA/Tae2 family protein
VRLKTKIKILENDMNKQERAMEEFITKFQLNQGNGGATNAITGLSSPLLNAATGGQFGTPGTTGQPNMSLVNSGLRDISGVNQHMSSIMSSLPKPFLQQNETFLVMSLKKQVKELKAECQKKEEDLDNVRKSLKNTRQQEIDIEIKSYIDECQRLRQLLSDMLRDGPAHPLYQERLSQLE